MFEDIDEIRRMRKKYNLKMYRSGVSAFSGIEQVEEEALKDGALARRDKELIALGISISKACYG